MHRADDIGGWSSLLLIGGFGVLAVGMGLGYARTTVAMLGESTDEDRGFNSSALSIADSLAAAVAVTLAGLAFAVSESTGLVDPFGAVSSSVCSPRSSRWS